MADWWKDDSGLEKLMRDSADGVGFAAEFQVRKAGLETMAIAVATCPVKTGALKASHTIDFDGSGTSRRVSATTGPEADYAHYVHDGTSRQAPQPWLDRAADAVEPGFYAAMEALAARDTWVSSRRHRG